jgi:hypothetical protein
MTDFSKTLINFDNFKVRCSAIGKVMSNSRSNPCLTEKQALRLDELEKKEVLTEKMKEELADLLIKKANGSKIILSDTCIEYLMEVYAWEVLGKQAVTKELDMEYTRKGKIGEPESIKLLSLVDGMLYEKNEERWYNEFLSGEPDIFHENKIIDIKTCWDCPGFLKKINCSLENGYSYQIRGYLDITGATEGEVVYALINTPETIVNDYKRKLFYQMEVVTEESPEYVEAVANLVNSMYFDDIPMHKRVFRVKVEPFSDQERQKLYDRVKVCRDWLNEFHEMYQKLNFVPSYSNLQ